MTDAEPGISPAPPRTAVFVDYENLYYADKAAYGPHGLKRLAADLLSVARECGPVTLAKAIAPFDDIPGAADAFHQAGFDPLYSTGGQVKNAADLLVVQQLVSVEPQQGIGVVFLVSGDGGMLGAMREAQRRGLKVVVVACERALSAKLRNSADKVLSIGEVQAEAGRLLRGQSPGLGLEGLAAAARATVPPPPAAAGPSLQPGPQPGLRSGVEPNPPSSLPVPGSVFQTTPSALKVFARCPRQYRLIYVDGRPVPPNRHLFVGNCVHQALKDFFGLEPRKRTPAVLEDLLRRAWETSPERRQVFPEGSEAEEAEVGREVIAELRSFCRRTDFKAVPLNLEFFGRTEIGEGVLVTGKVDRLDAGSGPGRVVVIDYKTGRPPTAKPSLFDEFQLPLYAAMVSEARAETVEKVVLQYLRDSVRYEYYLGEADIRRAKERAGRLAQGIRGARDFPARENPLCPWCAFLEDCPARSRVLERLAARTTAADAAGAPTVAGGAGPTAAPKRGSLPF